MEPNERERHVLASLSQSGEGQVIYEYLGRLADHLRDEVVDDPTATMDDLAGVRMSRKIIQQLQDRFVERARMGTGIDHLS